MSFLFVLPALFAMTLVQQPAKEAGAPETLPVKAAHVLWKNCFSCHNDFSKKGGLSLQTYEALMQGGYHGPSLVPGKSDESQMVLMMEGIVEPAMPVGGAVLDEDLKLIRDWIDRGAPPWPANLPAPKLNIPDIRPKVPVEPQIASLAYRSDGKLLAVGAYKEVRLLDAGTRQIQRRLTGHAEAVRSLSFSADGKLLAAAGGAPGRFGEVRIWDVESGSLRHTLQGHTDCIYSTAFSPNGKWLATSSYDRTIKLWDAAGGTELRTLKDHVDAVFSLAFSPDGTRLASASADRTVKIWNAETGERLATMSEATDALYAVAFHPGGDLIAAAGVDKRIRLWKLGPQGGELVRSSFAHDAPILHLAFVPDGKTLISASADRLVKFWEVETFVERKVIGPQSDWVLALAISPDGKWLATGQYDGSLSFHEVNGNERAENHDKRSAK